MVRSRISRKLERQSRNSLILSIAGIAIIIALLIHFGPPFLVSMTSFVSGTSENQQQQDNKNSFVAPPVLIEQYEATNSAQINVSGSSLPNTTIQLFVNGRKIDEIQADDGEFSFDNVRLKNGENEMRTKAIDKDKNESEFSNTYVVIYKNDPPTLSVESPSDGQTFKKDDSPAIVKGKTDAGVTVMINNFRAIVDSEGNFSYTLPLRGGENTIRVVAQDISGNKAEEELSVTYEE